MCELLLYLSVRGNHIPEEDGNGLEYDASEGPFFLGHFGYYLYQHLERPSDYIVKLLYLGVLLVMKG